MQKLLFTFSFIILFFSCNEHKNKIFEPIVENNDSVFTWLSTKENQKDSTYLPVFFKHYDQLIAVKKYDSAAKTICATGSILAHYGQLDTNFTNRALLLLQNNAITINSKYKTHLYGVLGGIYSFTSKFDTSVFYLKKALIEPNDFYSYHFVADAEYHLSTIYLFKGMMDSSFYFSQASFEKYEHFDMSSALGILVDRCGLNIFLGDFEEAKRVILLTDSLAKHHKDNKAIFNNWANKAYLSSITGGSKADTINTEYIDIVDSMYQFYKQWKPTSLRFNFLAQKYQVNKFIALKNYPEANRYLDSADKYLQKMEYKNSFLNQDYKYTKLAYELKTNFNIANITDYQKLIDRYKENREFIKLFEVYTLFSEVYNGKKDYKQALVYNKLAVDVKDSMSRIKLVQTVKDLDKKYQTVKKEKQIEEQQSKITKLILSIIGLLLLTIAFFTYRKRKEAQAEVIRQQKFTDELLQNTEDERKRIATDLHDGVNHELLTLKNQATNGKPANAYELEKVINEVRQVSRDLYPAMFDNIGLAASIEALCERMTEAGLFTSCEINYSLKLSKRNELQLYRIIQEALNNTLKHAKANAAKVTIDTVENELQVEIKDNGIGFDTNEKMNSSSSFGIQSLMQRARAIGGKSTIESNETGTKLILKTPIR